MSMSFSPAAPLHRQPNGYTWPQPDKDINFAWEPGFTKVSCIQAGAVIIAIGLGVLCSQFQGSINVT